MQSQPKKRICILSTGGTIEKVYDESNGTLVNQTSILDQILDRLVLEGIRVETRSLFNKDSLDMTDADRALIVAEVEDLALRYHGLVIVHGTDRLATTGELLHERCSGLPVPVVLTGAMRPFALASSDALQNVTESLIAVQLLDPGVYVCMHNRVIRFPGAVKDHNRRTFARVEELDGTSR